jgi:hypothetical protein|uniref:Uncharacterized protein n=1 Tax=Desulfobacca acetoxidans TaxID=60893 RepID=A0A7C5EQU6_9BACT
MNIDFALTGGYASLNLTLQVETENLPAELAAQIEAKVAEAGFFELLPEALKPKEPGPPDVLTYRISISTPGRSQTVVVNDLTAPEALRPLLGILQDLAWEQRRRAR